MLTKQSQRIQNQNTPHNPSMKFLQSRNCVMLQFLFKSYK